MFELILLVPVLVPVPGLVPPHPVASDQLDWPVGGGGVKAVVVRHHLLTLGVSKHLGK